MLLALTLSLFTQLFGPGAHADSVDVSYLTHVGLLKLKTWTDTELKTLRNHKGQISSQKMILEDSTQNLELNDRAEVDLVTLYGADQTARVPRFMIWRGFLKLQLANDGSLNATGESNRLLVPSSIFTVNKIKRIELSRASFLYPETELHLRTNPAASRGEKLFTQSCLACHSLPSAPKLKPETLTDAQLNAFANQHKTHGSLVLDAKALRGLIAYRDALVTEHSEVKSKHDPASN